MTEIRDKHVEAKNGQHRRKPWVAPRVIISESASRAKKNTTLNAELTPVSTQAQS